MAPQAPSRLYHHILQLPSIVSRAHQYTSPPGHPQSKPSNLPRSDISLRLRSQLDDVHLRLCPGKRGLLPPSAIGTPQNRHPPRLRRLKISLILCHPLFMDAIALPTESPQPRARLLVRALTLPPSGASRQFTALHVTRAYAG